MADMYILYNLVFKNQTPKTIILNDTSTFRHHDIIMNREKELEKLVFWFGQEDYI